MENNTNGTMWAWIIGIVVVLALIIGWVALSNDDNDLSLDDDDDAGEMVDDDDDNDDIDGDTDNLDEAAARVGARVELAVVRARIEAGESYAEAADDVREIRDDLAAAYADAEADAQV